MFESLHWILFCCLAGHCGFVSAAASPIYLPVDAAVTPASMMVVLKWVWLKDASTLLLVHNISLKVSSLP